MSNIKKVKSWGKWFHNFLKDGTKLKIPSEITPPLMLKLGIFFSRILISPLFKHPSQHKYLRLVKYFNSRNLESLILEVWAILSVTKFSLAYSIMLSRDFPVIPVSLKSRFLSFLSLKLISNEILILFSYKVEFIFSEKTTKCEKKIFQFYLTLHTKVPIL